MVTLKSTSQGIEISSHSRDNVIDMVKRFVSPDKRNFCWDRKKWIVDYSQKAEAVYIAESINGKSWVGDLTYVNPVSSVKMFQVFYIGQYGKSFDNAARATLDPFGKGSWTLIVSENAVRQWETWGQYNEVKTPEAKPENYYEILGIGKQATLREIKKSYRGLAKIHHPDAGGKEEDFSKLSNAYSVLSDPPKKSAYDFGLMIENESRAPKKPNAFRQQSPKCGNILATVEGRMGLNFVQEIHAWKPITKNGKTLETRWQGKKLIKEWV